jgi:hypothetical protein
MKEEQDKVDSNMVKFEALKELTIENHILKFMNNLEISANLHRDFWEILSEPRPGIL